MLMVNKIAVYFITVPNKIMTVVKMFFRFHKK